MQYSEMNRTEFQIELLSIIYIKIGVLIECGIVAPKFTLKSFIWPILLPRGCGVCALIFCRFINSRAPFAVNSEIESVLLIAMLISNVCVHAAGASYHITCVCVCLRLQFNN